MSKEIENAINKKQLLNENVLKIAILSSFTINGIKEILQVKSAEINVQTEFYVGGYNQYAQEILDPGSGLYNFMPDLVIIFLDTISMLGDHYFLPYKISAKERRILIDEKIVEITNLAEKITQTDRQQLFDPEHYISLEVNAGNPNTVKEVG